ncbi:hypothetical protein DEU56DRAFT_812957 [Suillus clintonianus]|uniref:uncharacterized protein n=1 Tax=Suillus clintonianus TaxID=1904413 RepID=UPI001B885952|nr:uncharacterized protein DEU56DRAFT_812957 [Suillus clintonianus]KAG2132073.1 hypothetical protein DEU56DRAFT_812957 [Suillus clintonianus]
MRVLALSDCKLESHEPPEEIEDTCTNSRPAPMPPPPTKIPSIILDADLVTDSMAARLCISLVGHVLFLKSQVPFPVMQMARMPGGDATSRAAKKRQELLNSFDTLASHLNTTFTALSTAFALCSGTPGKDAQNSGRAYLAVVLGPTPGSAKCKVMVGVDALEAKVWGERNDCSGEPSELGREGAEDVEEQSDNEEESDSDNNSDGEADFNEKGGSDSSDDSGDEESDESSQAPSPPPSRTPSPSSSPPPPPQLLPHTYAQELEAHRTAERLLSRTLASACGENDGQGMASEMAPTQTHIVLRAPRKFMHPAWVPRQTLSGAFDALLDQFLEESGEHPTRDDIKKKKKGGKVEGVWIRSRQRIIEDSAIISSEEIPEEDEMIWWTWDGRLVGFADW